MAPSERIYMSDTEQIVHLPPLNSEQWRPYRKRYNRAQFARNNRVRKSLLIGAIAGSTPALVAGVIMILTGTAPVWLFAISLVLLIPELALCCREANHYARTRVRRGETNQHLIEWVHAERLREHREQAHAQP